MLRISQMQVTVLLDVFVKNQQEFFDIFDSKFRFMNYCVVLKFGVVRSFNKKLTG